MIYGKVPPQAPELEAAVLGAVMLERDKLGDALELIPTEEVFYVEANQKIWKTIATLYARGSAVDLLTVTDWLRSTDELESVGGAYYVTQLTLAVTGSAHLDSHIRILLEKWIARTIIAECYSTVGKLFDGEDVFDSADTLATTLSKCNGSAGSATEATAAQIVISTIQEIQQTSSSSTGLVGVDTGLAELNRYTRGWQAGNLIILAARPSMGKTALALNLARAANTSPHHKPAGVYIASLEMTKRELMKRMLSDVSGVDYGKIVEGNLSQDDWAQLNRAESAIGSMNLVIDDRATVNVPQLSNRVKRLKKKRDIGLVIVDYLQLLQAIDAKGKSREVQVSEMSRMLKAMAKDCEVPVIALCQMSRSIEEGRRKPQLSDLRESGAIEADADVVMFLHFENQMMICIRKNRSGKKDVDITEVKFIGQLQRWCDENQDAPFESFKAHTPGIANARAGITDEMPF